MSHNAKFAGTSAYAKRTGKLVAKLAHGKEDVLLVGEPGTGKRTLGIEIHNERGRKKPVVILDAGSAFDSEVRAVLTGGYGDPGEGMVGKRLVPLADHTSLIIAEAEKLAPHNQSLLVSFLKEGRKKYEGLKIIVTISEPLESLGQSGIFSSDLVGYLEKFEVVEVPALRERLEDIPALVAAITKQMCASFGKSSKEIETNTDHILSQGQWPGNIRQLAAVVGKAVLISHGDKLELPGDFLDERQHLTDAIENIMSGKVFVLDQSLDLIEKLLIQRALKQFMYNQSKTAQVLGLSEANFRYRLKKFGLPSIRQKAS